jgi:Protein of unknown function (DUF1501)
MNTRDSFYTSGRPHTQACYLNRRQFLERAGGGFGMLGLAGLLDQLSLLASEAAPAGPLQPRATHFPAKAKAVVWCFMYGGPSGIDLFDPKPELDRNHGKPFGKGEVMTFSGRLGPLMKSPFTFKPYGQCGHPVAEVYSHIAEHVDDIAFLKSCHVETNVHDQALFQVNTGLTRLGFPSAGSWVTYGLGSENQNLPGYIVMHDPRGMPVGGPPLWSAGFLPNSHQGTVFRLGSSPILNLTRPDVMSEKAQRHQLDLLAEINTEHHRAHPAEADLLGRIASFELAYRMQMTAPDAVDISKETDETKELYGIDTPASRVYGTQCLMARRLVERGVRFIQIYSGGVASEWDSHDNLATNHRLRCQETDVPIAGLLTDLKRRGLLASTLVIWGGEFGRLPMSQGGDGRDHNPHGFLMWMAGGGTKGGVSYGETDEIGFKAAGDPVSIHDIHATILHLLGLDHKRLTYFHNGRDFRLTDVAGNVIERILA